MTPQQFIEKFREAFGEAVPMPIAFWYGDTAVNPESRVTRCMIGAIRKVCDGNPVGHEYIVGLADSNGAWLKSGLHIKDGVWRFVEDIEALRNEINAAE